MTSRFAFPSVSLARIRFFENPDIPDGIWMIDKIDWHLATDDHRLSQSTLYGERQWILDGKGTAEAIQHNLYMNDYLDSAGDVKGAVERATGVKELAV